MTEVSWAPGDFSAQTLFETHLPFYSADTAHKHLFFGTGGRLHLPLLVQRNVLVATFGPLWLSDGLSSACCLVPYVVTDHELQPAQARADTERERPVLVFLAGHLRWEGIREQLYQQTLAWMQRHPGSVVLLDHRRDDIERHDVTGSARRNMFAIFTAHMLKFTFCLISPGDQPNQGRIFQAVLAGCIPVVLSGIRR